MALRLENVSTATSGEWRGMGGVSGHGVRTTREAFNRIRSEESNQVELD